MSAAKEAHINSERAELLRRYDKGEPVDQGPLLDALTWRLRNQAREITRLQAENSSLRQNDLAMQRRLTEVLEYHTDLKAENTRLRAVFKRTIELAQNEYPEGDHPDLDI